jgi:hypothetical protein
MNWDGKKAEEYFSRQADDLNPNEFKYKNPQVDYHRYKFDSETAKKELYELCALSSYSKQSLTATLEAAKKHDLQGKQVYDQKKYLQAYRQLAIDIYNLIEANSLQFEMD